MSSANCPETPRQRMIGMMYLVLTAMLALNVSKDILDAFIVVDETLIKTNENFERKVEGSYAQFGFANANEPGKVGPFYKKALEVKEHTKKIIDLFNQAKWELISIAEKKTVEEVTGFTVREIMNKDDYSTPTHYFIGASASGEAVGKAKELKEAIIEYRKSLLDLVDEKERKAFDEKIGLDVVGPFYDAGGKEVTWEYNSFYGSIMAASVTLLNKTIGEIRNAEFDILSYLMRAITAGDFTFDRIEAKVIPNSRIVFTGTEFEADIIVAAVDTRTQPEVYFKMGIEEPTQDMIPSMTKVEGDSGMVKLRIPAAGIGEQKFAGFIKLKNPDGEDTFYPFHESYSVAKSSATVAADKMNVFYAELDNSVSASAPVPPDKIRISGGGLAFRGSGGKYTVTPPTSMIGKTVNVTISAEIDGKSQSFGGTPFRIMKVPDPRIAIGNIRGGRRSKAEIVNSPIVVPKDESFAYDLNWRVTGFTMTVGSGRSAKTASTGGNRFSGEMQGYINAAEPGSPLIVYDVKVTPSVDGKSVNVRVNPDDLGVSVRLK